MCLIGGEYKYSGNNNNNNKNTSHQRISIENLPRNNEHYLQVLS